MTLLSVRELTKHYPASDDPAAGGAPVEALRGVDFDIVAGEFVALMGPSGCGKTTLLHLLGAMDRPTSGRVLFDGVELATLDDAALARERRTKLGFVFQFFNLLPTLRVEENVALPLLLEGSNRKPALARARELLERVGLAARARHYATALSGGEMQRAAVARALVSAPRLVLADEPTGSLDSSTGERVLELLAELNEELGLTLIIATHSEEVAQHSRKRILLRDGRIESIRADPDRGPSASPAAGSSP